MSHVCLHLHVGLMVQPPYQPFGSKYIMEIPDTVVEGHEGFTEGSEEYMVFEKVLLTQAARHGLHPVRSLLCCGCAMGLLGLGKGILWQAGTVTVGLLCWVWFWFWKQQPDVVCS